MMITKIAIALFVTTLALFVGPNAEAEGFVKLGDIKGEATDNDHIKGEATDEDHKDWILIQSMVNLGDIKGEATDEDIKGEATDNDHKDWILVQSMVNLGDIKGEATDEDHIKGEATDNDHKDWVIHQVMMYCDLVDMGFTAEQAGQIVQFTMQRWHMEEF